MIDALFNWLDAVDAAIFPENTALLELERRYEAGEWDGWFTVRPEPNKTTWPKWLMLFIGG